LIGVTIALAAGDRSLAERVTAGTPTVEPAPQVS